MFSRQTFEGLVQSGDFEKAENYVLSFARTPIELTDLTLLFELRKQRLYELAVQQRTREASTLFSFDLKPLAASALQLFNDNSLTLGLQSLSEMVEDSSAISRYPLLQLPVSDQRAALILKLRSWTPSIEVKPPPVAPSSASSASSSSASVTSPSPPSVVSPLSSSSSSSSSAASVLRTRHESPSTLPPPKRARTAAEDLHARQQEARQQQHQHPQQVWQHTYAQELASQSIADSMLEKLKNDKLEETKSKSMCSAAAKSKPAASSVSSAARPISSSSSSSNSAPRALPGVRQRLEKQMNSRLLVPRPRTSPVCDMLVNSIREKKKASREIDHLPPPPPPLTGPLLQASLQMEEEQKRKKAAEIWKRAQAQRLQAKPP